ncbi:uncharacterized protein ATNIH1004_002383 [Aspergillus tanneri]|uniref:Zn(2)-C6 fungal-type domain-containing protein n=1 Tax=Aspergillus tanneri TaxID=1220188 RepID=A0A5M9MYI2_9EURO|nr:uncharacterized protein ATNIH1004_002383 [Aspergillus tanneri]KAA8649709.1 hypothetical protein ATNIH1004_002383 [Aspergillus tanneri]
MHHRSHDGCWTCKARHRKCDRYEVRLRWGTGIASRGRFTGAKVPVVTSIPKGARQSQSLAAADTLERNLSAPDPAGMTLLSSGIDILHSATLREENLRSTLPALCEQSKALYAVCLAHQVSLSSKLQFLRSFDAAVNLFRSELRSATVLKDGTFTAGLLLCSTGMMHGLPWATHLQEMHHILQLHEIDTPDPPTGLRAHLLDVMGVMDLPTCRVGGMNPSLGVWRRYCRNRHPRNPHRVEVVSGLPRSLLDLFSCIGEGQGGTTEDDFWNWPGTKGTLLQCQLWEAYRLAGVLTVRCSSYGPLRAGSPRCMQDKRQPSTEVLVVRILSHVDATGRGGDSISEGKDGVMAQAVHYPVFMAGLQTDILNGNPELKPVIRRSFSGAVGRGRALLDLLEDWWDDGSACMQAPHYSMGLIYDVGSCMG